MSSWTAWGIERGYGFKRKEWGKKRREDGRKQLLIHNYWTCQSKKQKKLKPKNPAKSTKQTNKKSQHKQLLYLAFRLGSHRSVSLKEYIIWRFQTGHLVPATCCVETLPCCLSHFQGTWRVSDRKIWKSSELLLLIWICSALGTDVVPWCGDTADFVGSEH